MYFSENISIRQWIYIWLTSFQWVGIHKSRCHDKVRHAVRDAVKKVQLSKQTQNTCLKLDSSKKKIRENKTEISSSISEFASCNVLKEESSSSECDTTEQANTNWNSNEERCLKSFANSFNTDCKNISESTIFEKKYIVTNSVRSQIENPFDDDQGQEIGLVYYDRPRTSGMMMTHSLPFASFDEWEDVHDLVLSINSALAEIQANELEYLPTDFLSNTSTSFDSPDAGRELLHFLVDPRTLTCTQNDERLPACKSLSPDPFLSVIDETLGPLRCDEKSE
jgi:hypothetical protein